MESNIKQIFHLLWQYLKQPIFNSENQSVWNIHRFWYLYKIKLLQKCWEKECDTESQQHL
jgi:hypothetical protein